MAELVEELQEILVDTKRTKENFRPFHPSHGGRNLDAVAALAYMTRRVELLVEACEEGRVDA